MFHSLVGKVVKEFRTDKKSEILFNTGPKTNLLYRHNSDSDFKLSVTGLNNLFHAKVLHCTLNLLQTGVEGNTNWEDDEEAQVKEVPYIFEVTLVTTLGYCAMRFAFNCYAFEIWDDNRANSEILANVITCQRRADFAGLKKFTKDF